MACWPADLTDRCAPYGASLITNANLTSHSSFPPRPRHVWDQQKRRGTRSLRHQLPATIGEDRQGACQTAGQYALPQARQATRATSPTPQHLNDDAIQPILSLHFGSTHQQGSADYTSPKICTLPPIEEPEQVRPRTGHTPVSFCMVATHPRYGA